MDLEWLQQLKVGDEVIVDGGAFATRSYITRVARLTKTLIITEKGTRFNREFGRQSGDSWHKAFLQEPTQPAKDLIRHEILVQKLKRVDWRPVPLSTLESILAILAKTQGKGDNGDDDKTSESVS